MTVNKGLGRGFDALIPQNFDNSLLLDEDERIQKLPISKVAPDTNQPRQHFDDEALTELAQSIKQHGILQPLVVTAIDDGYQIIAGERRWRAAKLAKLPAVPAIVRTIKEQQRLEIALVENVQRVDLSPLEQAVTFERLRQQFNVTLNDMAKRLGKSPSGISNTMRLLNLPEEARTALASGHITEGHARSILALTDRATQLELLHNIVKQGWTVRQAERFVTSIKAGVKDSRETRARVFTETPVTKALGKRLRAPVAIRRMAKGGKLEISFKSDDDLARLIELLERLNQK